MGMDFSGVTRPFVAAHPSKIQARVDLEPLVSRVCVCGVSKGGGGALLKGFKALLLLLQIKK
jgi:hypothetical protein